MAKVVVSGLVNVETGVNIGSFPLNYAPINYSFFGVETDVSGVGYNVSIALTKLGDNVTIASLIGKDNISDFVKTSLVNNGVSDVQLEQSLKGTPLSTVLFDNSGKREIFCDLKDIQESQYDKEIFTTLLNGADIAVMCNINYNRPLLNIVKSSNIPIATDVHIISDINDDYNSEFMRSADILFCSDEGIQGSVQDFIINIADIYHNKIIVIGCGSKGAILYTADGGKITFVPSVKTRKIVNTCGAGDSLFSAFVHFYANGNTPLQSLQKAVYFASYKIGVNGGAKGFVTEKELAEIMEKYPQK